MGWIANSFEAQVPLAYALSLLFFAPLALTYVERAMSAPGSQRGDLLGLIRAGGGGLLAFAGGWLLLLGYLGLMALLAWGLALALGVLGQYLFNVALDPRRLALLPLLLVGLNHLMGVSSIGSLRARLVYGALANGLRLVG